MQLISFSVLSELRADWAGQNYPPVCFFFCFFFVVLKSSWLGESRCHLSPCRSRFFFFLIFLSPPTELKKPNLFGFSYVMVRGMITSWQGTSCQLETSYLWHLLSNCCSWTVTPPFTSISTSLGCLSNFLGCGRILSELCPDVCHHCQILQ